MIRNKKGFTLVELLAVIVILAIILVIAVPKVMSVITDSKKATLESTAKMIASTAEKAKIQNKVLGNNETITCESVAKLNDIDYEDCKITFDGDKANVTLKGSGKFAGMFICSGTKTNSTTTNESCTLRLLTVNLDGGVDNVDYKAKYEAASIVTLTEPTKEGYVFKEWVVTGEGASVNENELTMGTENTIVTAIWYQKGAAYITNLLKNEATLANGLIRTSATYTNADNEEITVDAGIRYVGENPNNYVYFNCEATDGTYDYGHKDYNYASSCETWRIIGVFDVEDGAGNIEKRIKIINTASTFQVSWDSSSPENEGYGINQWGESTYIDSDGNKQEYLGADIKQLLNGYYIGKAGSECKYNISRGSNGFFGTCTESSLTTAKMKPLTSTAKDMIDNAIWYTYAVDGFKNASDGYLKERGITLQYTGKSLCQNSGNVGCNDTVERTTTWTGLVGLMSASEVTYANGWLYNGTYNPWTITPYPSASANIVLYSTSNYLSNNRHAYRDFGIWPSVYLDSNVQIIDGNGNTVSYKLSL